MEPARDAVVAVAEEIGNLGGDFLADVGNAERRRRRGSTVANERNIVAKICDAYVPSCMVYAVADMREVSREYGDEMESRNKEGLPYLELPAKIVDICSMFQSNIDILKKYVEEDKLATYASILAMIGNETICQGQEGEKEEEQATEETKLCSRSSVAAQRIAERQGGEMLFIGDSKTKSELVYAIGVNHKVKEINVAFRGSVTTADFITDSKLFLTLRDNPLWEKSDNIIPQNRLIGLHLGFVDYLFGKKQPDQHSKYDEIRDHLRSMLKDKYTDYTIMTCGHSLGGALATIVAFQLSFEDFVQHPIDCITLGSPRCGNTAFLRAFQEQELARKIFYIRLVNDRDIVTMHPDRLTVCSFCLTDEIFRHVGLEMRLLPLDDKESYNISYFRVHRSRIRQFFDDSIRAFENTAIHFMSLTFGCCYDDYSSVHSLGEYFLRMERASEIMTELSTRQMFDEYYKTIERTSSVELKRGSHH